MSLDNVKNNNNGCFQISEAEEVKTINQVKCSDQIKDEDICSNN